MNVKIVMIAEDVNFVRIAINVGIVVNVITVKIVQILVYAMIV